MRISYTHLLKLGLLHIFMLIFSVRSNKQMNVLSLCARICVYENVDDKGNVNAITIMHIALHRLMCFATNDEKYRKTLRTQETHEMNDNLFSLEFFHFLSMKRNVFSVSVEWIRCQRWIGIR